MVEVERLEEQDVEALVHEAVDMAVAVVAMEEGTEADLADLEVVVVVSVVASEEAVGEVLLPTEISSSQPPFSQECASVVELVSKSSLAGGHLVHIHEGFWTSKKTVEVLVNSTDIGNGNLHLTVDTHTGKDSEWMFYLGA